MEETRKDRAQEEILEFVRLFPQVEPQEVPREVWQQVREGKSLALAYAVDRGDRLERELMALRSQVKGEALSTGSVSSAGADPGGTLAAYWDAYAV